MQIPCKEVSRGVLVCVEAKKTMRVDRNECLAHKRSILRTTVAVERFHFQELSTDKQFQGQKCRGLNDKTAASSVVVYYNSTERKNGPEIQAKRFARHPKFVLSVYANDIAVLQLEKPLNFDKFVSPVCLPKKPLNIAGRPLLIAGWGLTKEGGQDSDTLRYILKKEMPYKQCKPFLHTEAQLTLNETIVVCATARSKDACTGDSGGPVTTWNKRGKFFQVGIVSFGYGCARPNQASGYTRVATFVPWILSVMKRYERDGHSK
ncbi:proclotting enzyme-like isoform X5 [Dermacentor variabilis]|uniref:proclotting enzyme-like isoform X5 n=1 Tax=Dermacentor variabilis TaxID=34621 RepID=UPI003F5C5BB8